MRFYSYKRGPRDHDIRVQLAALFLLAFHLFNIFCEHSGSYSHRHQLLEQKFTGIRNVDLQEKEPPEELEPISFVANPLMQNEKFYIHSLFSFHMYAHIYILIGRVGAHNR